MPQANPVNWFEIPAKDLARSKKFYETVFGLTLSDLDIGPAKMAMFEMEKDNYGAAGALVQSEGYTPSHDGSIVYFNVPSIEATLEAITAAGGKTLLPMTSIGEHGHIAHFEDTEGARVALHQSPA